MKRFAFLGPSRPDVVPPGVTVLPPARQGDVWRALAKKPMAIALIDGVFEHQPSVWHRELLEAIDAGVQVFGAASMGALRAAELHTFGMVAVGKIAADYCAGRLLDDADVALLHADAAHGFRPLTVPLVDAREAIATAVAARALRPTEAARLIRAAEATHYSERSWGRLTREAKVRSSRWLAFLEAGPPSLKKRDAALCLARLAKTKAVRSPEPRFGIGSSFQRRARAVATGKAVAEPTPADLAAAARLARELNIDPARDPSGLRGIAHRLLHDGLLRVNR